MEYIFEHENYNKKHISSLSFFDLELLVWFFITLELVQNFSISSQANYQISVEMNSMVLAWLVTCDSSFIENSLNSGIIFFGGVCDKVVKNKCSQLAR